MPQLDFDGANSRISADKIQGQSGTTVTIPAGHNLVGDGSGLTNLPAHTGNVAFPATQVASADANTLDDYEEGTWTPALSFNGNAVGMTYTTQSATYTRIGRIAHIQARITLSAKGSSTGGARVTGWPFSANSGAGEADILVHCITAIDWVGSTHTSLIGNLSGGTCHLRAYGDNVAQASIQDGGFTNTSDFTMSGVYYI
jgi:hypothetical protein